LPAIGFAGFPAEAMKFFRGLEKNNQREWFQPRKEIFDMHVKAPMVALVQAINQSMATFAPEYITTPEHAIYRIYRDTRFSKDKTPYKTHIAASFKKRGLHKHAAGGFYFGVSHKEIGIAGGVYMPGPQELLAIRTHLAENHASIQKLLANAKVRRLVGDLKGEALTRVPKGFARDHPAADLIRMKQWHFWLTLDPALATTSKLFTEIVDRFKTMLPVIEFLNVPLKPQKLEAKDLLA
jgi:uncharacterized protein (TIGR02453 family)